MAVEIGLVACSQQKLTGVSNAQARWLYCSPLFRKSAAYVQHRCGRWYILSAKHGLVHPDQWLEPYDERLPKDTAQWEDTVRSQLELALLDVAAPHLVVLAGEQYRGAVLAGPWTIEVPMQGLGIGEQLHWLTEQLEAV